jgi:hypothetical protein
LKVLIDFVFSQTARMYQEFGPSAGRLPLLFYSPPILRVLPLRGDRSTHRKEKKRNRRVK